MGATRQESKLAAGVVPLLEAGEKVEASVIARPVQERGRGTLVPVGLVLTTTRLAMVAISPPIGLGIGGAVREIALSWDRPHVRGISVRRRGIGWTLELMTTTGTRHFDVNVGGHARQLAAALQPSWPA